MEKVWVPVEELLEAVLDGRVREGPLAAAVLTYDALKQTGPPVTTERTDRGAAARARASSTGTTTCSGLAREKVGYDFDRLELTDTEMCRAVGVAHRPAAAARRGSGRAVLVGVRAGDAGR